MSADRTAEFLARLELRLQRIETLLAKALAGGAPLPALMAGLPEEEAGLIALARVDREKAIEEAKRRFRAAGKKKQDSALAAAGGKVHKIGKAKSREGRP